MFSMFHHLYTHTAAVVNGSFSSHTQSQTAFDMNRGLLDAYTQFFHEFIGNLPFSDSFATLYIILLVLAVWLALLGEFPVWMITITLMGLGELVLYHPFFLFWGFKHMGPSLFSWLYPTLPNCENCSKYTGMWSHHNCRNHGFAQGMPPEVDMYCFPEKDDMLMQEAEGEGGEEEDGEEEEGKKEEQVCDIMKDIIFHEPIKYTAILVYNIKNTAY
ncbi:hypothetical protein BJV82DRAFT_31681 [Fennellomyces sp. T-0311]|nr:hypothetical protein BJV82DRAFT_31681 [Fennellomyces sp. T-0311]